MTLTTIVIIGGVCITLLSLAATWLHHEYWVRKPPSHPWLEKPSRE